MNSASLLKQIADALGMDVEAFGYTIDSGSQGTAANTERQSGETAELLRLIVAFQALPTLEARRKALQLIEELGANTGDGALPHANGED